MRHGGNETAAPVRPLHICMLLWKMIGFRRLLVLFVLRRIWRMYQRRRPARA
jgi:hypothetical protein